MADGTPGVELCEPGDHDYQLSETRESELCVTKISHCRDCPGTLVVGSDRTEEQTGLGQFE